MNATYATEVQPEALTFCKNENDKKAKRAFENGIRSTEIQDRLITANLSTFSEAAEYARTQEIRMDEIPKNEIFCIYCKIPGHKTENCRKNKMNLLSRQQTIHHREQERYSFKMK